MHGQVRAILWQHLGSISPKAGAPDADPNDLVAADLFAHQLEQQGERHPASLRTLGGDYVDLWARTFRTLVRHLRGNPERALALFASEVYPYLRGDRLAARLIGPRNREAILLVQDDLPAEYLEGMVERFVALSGASATCQRSGKGEYTIRYNLDPADRLAALARLLAYLRIPLLLTGLLAAVVGVAFGSRAGPVDPWRGLAVLLGTVAAQSGANAWHDLIHPRHQGPLAAPGLTRGWLWFQALGSHATAAAALVFLVPGHLWLLAFAGVGLILSALYGAFRDHGWGPAIAAVTHGPMMVAGATYAVTGTLPSDTWLVAAPLGFVGAAILYLDDLADRPLDEAAGKRTLVVRLPQRRQVAGFATLLGLGIIALLVATGGVHLATLPPALFLGIAAGILVYQVKSNIEDPHGLAPARAGTLTIYMGTAALLAFMEVL